MRAAATKQPICEACRTFTPHIHPERLAQIGRGRNQVVFIGSMCDLWSDGVQPEWRAAIWEQVQANPQNSYIVLTKRPQFTYPWEEWPRGLPVNMYVETSITGDMSIGEIEAYCRSVQRRYRIRMVAIDYAQKIGKPDRQNEEQAFREVAQRLARLRDLLGSIPVIAPSQITDSGGDRRPMHARAFEQEADTVMDIDRNRDDEGLWERKAVLSIMKGRELDAGRWTLLTDFETGRWEHLDPRDERAARAA